MSKQSDKNSQETYCTLLFAMFILISCSLFTLFRDGITDLLLVAVYRQMGKLKYVQCGGHGKNIVTDLKITTGLEDKCSRCDVVKHVATDDYPGGNTGIQGLYCIGFRYIRQIHVLFICKTKSRLRRRHCGLARHFKTDPTETVALC
jgi:hypothetical protein